jgi:hypothetical protein
MLSFFFPFLSSFIFTLLCSASVFFSVFLSASQSLSLLLISQFLIQSALFLCLSLPLCVHFSQCITISTFFFLSCYFYLIADISPFSISFSFLFFLLFTVSFYFCLSVVFLYPWFLMLCFSHLGHVSLSFPIQSNTHTHTFLPCILTWQASS